MDQTTNNTAKRTEQKWVKYHWPQVAMQNLKYIRTSATNILIE